VVFAQFAKVTVVREEEEEEEEEEKSVAIKAPASRHFGR
jgi:hypothetical protein